MFAFARAGVCAHCPETLVWNGAILVNCFITLNFAIRNFCGDIFGKSAMTRPIWRCACFSKHSAAAFNYSAPRRQRHWSAAAGGTAASANPPNRFCTPDTHARLTTDLPVAAVTSRCVTGISCDTTSLHHQKNPKV